MLFRNLAQHVQCRLGQGDRLGSGFAVGQAGKPGFPVDPAPLQAQNFAEAGACIDQEPQYIYGAPILTIISCGAVSVGESSTQSNDFLRRKKAFPDALPKPFDAPARIDGGGHSSPFGPDRKDMGQECQAAVGITGTLPAPRVEMRDIGGGDFSQLLSPQNGEDVKFEIAAVFCDRPGLLMQECVVLQIRFGKCLQGR